MKEPDLLIILNPDVYRRKNVVRLIKANNGYCISQPKRDKSTKCHCEHFRKTGECFCGLFLAIEVIEVGDD